MTPNRWADAPRHSARAVDVLAQSLVDLASLSETQRRVARYLSRCPNVYGNIGGHGRAHWVQAAKALVRRGVLGKGTPTSAYFLRDEYVDAARALTFPKKG